MVTKKLAVVAVQCHNLVQLRASFDVVVRLLAFADTQYRPCQCQPMVAVLVWPVNCPMPIVSNRLNHRMHFLGPPAYERAMQTPVVVVDQVVLVFDFQQSYPIKMDSAMLRRLLLFDSCAHINWFCVRFVLIFIL